MHGKTILLLDEPDARLHPSAVYDMLNILKKRTDLGIQIIMTSHNPTTLCLAEDKNLFLLYEENFEVKIKSGLTKYEITNRLTSDLIHIEMPTKTLYVEGKDASFYKTLNKIINENSFYGIPFHFHLNITSLKKGFANKSKLIETVKVLEKSVYGIVDDDDDCNCGNIEYVYNLFHMKRYAKENYILDLINVFFYIFCQQTDLNSNIEAIQNSMPNQ